ncbi:hypothetical protein V9T40_014655 [Parthenolecanium corni]|uniref:Uncharacterized protein n=1 Tax=Parthenolecanium corni TaxID=536013 RepID=A0AAN9TGT2_9HEMI
MRSIKQPKTASVCLLIAETISTSYVGVLVGKVLTESSQKMVLFRGQSRSSNVESKSDYHVQIEDPATPRLLRISPLRHSYRIPPSRSLETSLYIDDSDADSIISAPAHGDDHISKGAFIIDTTALPSYPLKMNGMWRIM